MYFGFNSWLTGYKFVIYVGLHGFNYFIITKDAFVSHLKTKQKTKQDHAAARLLGLESRRHPRRLVGRGGLDSLEDGEGKV